MQYKVKGRPVESLCIKVRGESSRENVTGGLCHTHPNQEDMDKALFKQLIEAFKLQDLFLLGDLRKASSEEVQKLLAE